MLATHRNPAPSFLLALILALSACAVSAQGDAPIYKGGHEQWAWEGSIAKTFFDNGLHIAIAFASEDDCNTAYFGLVGNDQITSMSFIIDQSQYNWLDVEAVDAGEGTPLIGFALSDKALYELKHGQTLRVLTDQGNLTVGLRGTAVAFNNAYGNCLLSLHRRLEPTKKPVQSARALAPSKSFAPEKIARFDLENGATLIMFSGEFEQGDAQRIIAALEETDAEFLGLNSLGGLISEAQMVGYYLRSHNLAAVAGDTCASACTFALAGGVKRMAIKDSRIGLHQASFPSGSGSLEAGQQLVGNYIRYFQSMGVDAEVVALAATMPSEDIHWLDPQRALELKLIGEILP